MECAVDAAERDRDPIGRNWPRRSGSAFSRGATLIIAKLGRLARNVAFVSNLPKSGVDFVAVDFPQANRLTVHILAAVAEHEAAMISARTKAALAAAKARGRKLGGDRGNLASIRHLGTPASIAVRAKRADRKAADLAPIVQELRAGGATLAQVEPHQAEAAGALRRCVGFSPVAQSTESEGNSRITQGFAADRWRIE